MICPTPYWIRKPASVAKRLSRLTAPAAVSYGHGCRQDGVDQDRTRDEEPERASRDRAKMASALVQIASWTATKPAQMPNVTVAVVTPRRASRLATPPMAKLPSTTTGRQRQQEPGSRQAGVKPVDLAQPGTRPQPLVGEPDPLPDDRDRAEHDKDRDSLERRRIRVGPQPCPRAGLIGRTDDPSPRPTAPTVTTSVAPAIHRNNSCHGMIDSRTCDRNRRGEGAQAGTSR